MKPDVTQSRYRECFSTAAGKRVLGYLLADMGFFDNDLTTVEEMAVANYAKTILKNLGVFELSNADSFVNKLFEIPTKEKRNG